MIYTTMSDLFNGICDAIRDKDGTKDRIRHQEIPESILLLNLVERELSYQVFGKKKQTPMISESKTIYFGDESFEYDEWYPLKIIKNAK